MVLEQQKEKDTHSPTVAGRHADFDLCSKRIFLLPSVARKNRSILNFGWTAILFGLLGSALPSSCWLFPSSRVQAFSVSSTVANTFRREATTGIQWHSNSVDGHLFKSGTSSPISIQRPYQKRRALLSSSRNSSDGSSSSSSSIDPLILEAALSLKKISWVSWWAQMILTTISSVTLIFAKTVLSVGNPSSSSATGGLSSKSGGGGFFLAGVGVSLSFLSILWTWGEARLSRRLRRPPESYSPRITTAALTRRAITIGTTINLLGLGFTLVGALQIIGVLAAKALSFPNALNVNGVAGTIQTLQPLDILVVQANANTMLSHFCSLSLMLYWGQRWILKLDPPSKRNNRSGDSDNADDVEEEFSDKRSRGKRRR